MFDIKGLKAVSLLRASTEKQTDSDNDLPIQRKLVNAFIEKEELILIREFVEGGISGFKTEVKDRAALQDIKKMAKNQEFDILVVYKIDRIGRRDELYQEIKYINNYGIRIVATDGKELKTKTFTDKLLTSIELLSSEQESIKTSERVTDSQMIMVQEGRYRGGYIPYGYKLINNGNINFKGRIIYDFIIDNEQAEIIKIIYNLSIKNNMGARAIASYLNDNGYKSKSKNNTGWSFTTINNILSNSIYKGLIHMNSKLKKEIFFSEKQEDLVIIPEEIWTLNQQIIKNRKTTMKKENGTNEIIGITQGSGLLSGLVYCGYCENKMHMWNNHKYYYKKDGEKVKIIKSNYRCKSAMSTGRIKCEGQSTYSTKKIDYLVEKKYLEHTLSRKNKELSKDYIDQLLNNHKILLQEKKDKQKELVEKQKEILLLKRDYPKALNPEFNYPLSIEELRESIYLIQSDVDKLLEELNKLDDKINHSKILINKFNEKNQTADDLYERYLNADIIQKKMYLADGIKKVYIFKDKIDIDYDADWIVFENNSVMSDGSVREQFVLPSCYNTRLYNILFYRETIQIPVA
jgi:DNA invertase Pin-like site-specific DNA recombinase